MFLCQCLCVGAVVFSCFSDCNFVVVWLCFCVCVFVVAWLCFRGCVFVVVWLCFCASVFVLVRLCFPVFLIVILWWCGCVFVVVWLCFVFVWLCFCGGVVVFLCLCGCAFVVVFLWWCGCGCVFVMVWLCFYGGVVVFLWWCGCVFVVVWLCFCGCVFVVAWFFLLGGLRLGGLGHKPPLSLTRAPHQTPISVLVVFRCLVCSCFLLLLSDAVASKKQAKSTVAPYYAKAGAVPPRPLPLPRELIWRWTNGKPLPMPDCSKRPCRTISKQIKGATAVEKCRLLPAMPKAGKVLCHPAGPPTSGRRCSHACKNRRQRSRVA